VNRADKKIEGPLGKKIVRKSKNSHRLSGGGVGAKGMVIQRAIWRPGNKYKRSKIDFAVTSIAFSLGHLGATLLELAAQSLIGVPVRIYKKKNNHTMPLLLKCVNEHNAATTDVKFHR